MNTRASAQIIAKASAALRKNIADTFDGNHHPATMEDVAHLYVHCMLTLDTLVYSSELFSANITDDKHPKLLELIESSLDEMAKNFMTGLTKLQVRNRSDGE